MPDEMTAFDAGSLDVEDQKAGRSEEHTSELQSQSNLVCRLLLEKKKSCHPASCAAPTSADVGAMDIRCGEAWTCNRKLAPRQHIVCTGSASAHHDRLASYPTARR